MTSKRDQSASNPCTSIPPLIPITSTHHVSIQGGYVYLWRGTERGWQPAASVYAVRTALARDEATERTAWKEIGIADEI